ncbi:unnamed protein product, partial [Prorocentrum cordatum]
DSVFGRVARRVSSAGGPPTDLKSREALQELLRIKDLNTVEPSNLGCYDLDPVNLLTSGVSVKDMEDLLPDQQRAMLSDPDRHTFRDSSELEYDTGHLAPYWDPKLRFCASDRRRLIFRQDMEDLLPDQQRAMLSGPDRHTFRDSSELEYDTGHLAPYWDPKLRKKDRLQRLIADAGEPNRICKRPPHSRLGTVTALTGVELSDAAIRASSQDDGDLSWVKPSAGSVDLYNGFYQFRSQRMG